MEEQKETTEFYKKSDVVVDLDHVTKRYKLYATDRQAFLGIFFKWIKYKTMLASNDVSFKIRRGESVAIIGRNGAGKSTLLKLITEVAFPTSGTITVRGRVSALLELTAGFEPDFTGRENIYLKGHLMGIADEEMRTMEDDIIKFADIGDYIDQPTRTYSSGMKARLGFAISANIQPEILIIDEALSVGDVQFKERCLDKVKEIMSREQVTLIFVTHSVMVAQEFCARGILMEKGQLLFDGPIEETVEHYEKLVQPKHKKASKRIIDPFDF